MSSAATTRAEAAIPEFKQVLGHPAPLWMLFMSEFWERFAFYGIRWALVLYIVAQFHGGSATGQADANLTYGSYLALVYAAAIFGGYIADKILGYQRSILVGAVFMAGGLFMIAWPDRASSSWAWPRSSSATACSSRSSRPSSASSTRWPTSAATAASRSSTWASTPARSSRRILTGWLAETVFGTDAAPAYKFVFIAAGVGMLVSLVWFYFGRSPAARGSARRPPTPPAPGASCMSRSARWSRFPWSISCWPSAPRSCSTC